MSSRDFKSSIYEEFSRIGKALANGNRLELLDLLAQGERTVNEVAEHTGLTVANASQHLQVLRRSRLVETRKEGARVYYRLAGDRIMRLWQALRDVGEHRLAEVDQLIRDFAQERDALQPVSMEELLERMRAGAVEVLDVRPAEEYEAGHIAGARSIPLDELEARVEELPKDTEIVAYCRGPYCVFSDEAAKKLRERGFAVRRLDFGFPDWKVANLPVETVPD